MKKISLLMIMMVLGTVSFAQIIFQVQAPAGLAANYGLTVADGATWGTPNLNVPANGVTAVLKFVAAPGGDTLACSALPAGSLTGKIAVLYRGDCEFGSKALAAQNAGAKAVIIINNIGGAPVGMAGGTAGLTDTIPVIMISDVTGALLRDAIITGSITAFIGSKLGVFGIDLGANKRDIVRARRFSNIALLSKNAAEFSVQTGVWLRNYGSAAQSGAKVSVEIKFGGTSIFADTVSVATTLQPTAGAGVAGDSVFVSLATFSQATYANGYYSMTYTITPAGTDEDPSDNTLTADFMIDDSVYSYGRIDKVTNQLLSPSGSRPTTFGADYENCLAFEDPNGSRVAATGLTFSAVTNDPDVLTGEVVNARAYLWNDAFVDINDAGLAFDNLILLDEAAYGFSGDYQDSNIFIPFTTPIVLSDNQRYLFCFKSSSATMFVGFDDQIDYRTTQDSIYKQASFPLMTNVQATANLNGFGTDAVPAISVTMINSIGVGVADEETATVINAYPNPVKDVISIPVGNLTGDASLEIMDITGKIVKTQKVSFVTNDVLRVDVSNMSNGTYIFKLTLENGSANTFKVSVNK